MIRKQSGATARQRHAHCWLIVRRQNGGSKALTLDASGRLGGEDLLPVFAFEEEARMFLWARALDPGWSVRHTSKGELVSLLYGPYAGAKRVALDPLPCPGAASGMLTADREAVLGRLVDRGGHGGHRPRRRAPAAAAS